MKEGFLPIEGESTGVSYSREDKKITVEVNGVREELSVIGAIALIGKISAIVEVVLANG